MKWLILFFGVAAGLVAAEPTESREWTAGNGKTAEGRVLRIAEEKAVLERTDGVVVEVPLAVFIAEDRKLLEEHFEIGAAGAPEDSGAETATGLPFELGSVAGPVRVADGSSYHVYLPKSLKAGREAPLLFYTNAGGGNPRLISALAEGAEICGWIMAVSVESKNGLSLVESKRISRTAVAHLIETLPIDPERLYFTGNSGGGAMAMWNADELEGNGAMPNIAYNPQGCRPPKGFYYVLGGGRDYNRYLSAAIAERFGKDGVHRMNPGGHGGTTNWQRIDGILWLNARDLEDNRRDHADEALDFETAALRWLRQLPEAESHRAYSNARILKDDYEMTGANRPILDALIAELEKNRTNVLYHEGLLEIDELSEDEMAEFGEGGGSSMNHADPKVTRKAEELLEKYRGVPFIEATLEAIASPTVGG